MLFTTIGSRQTPDDILLEMTRFGSWIRDMDHWCRSGHADGADWAFEKGAQERCLVYLPWEGFNSQLTSNARKVIPPFDEKLDNLARQYHQKYDSLSDAVKKLMMRNCCQVLGLELNKPVDVVICWTPKASGSGGTGQALRIAKDYDIPIYDMAKCEYSTCEKLIETFEGRSLSFHP
jgi:hypothetical protein